MRGNGLGGSPSSFAVQLEGHTAFIPSDPAAHLRVYELEGYSAAFCSAHAACPEKFIPVW